MKTIIIGAGFAGLSAGHKLKKDFLILEKNERPGGLCRTDIVAGFTFDYTGHFLHLRKPETKKFILANCKVPLKAITRKASIYSNGVYTGYPYQVNSFGLPAKIGSENVAGFLKAKLLNKVSHVNFKQWVLTALGEGIAKNFMFPYNLKLFKFPLDMLSVNWMGRFVPSPDIDEVMKGILPKAQKDMGYNVNFYYPEKGGIESVIKGIYNKIQEKVRLNTTVKKIDLTKKIVFLQGGKQEQYTSLISTLPLKELTQITGDRELITLGNKLKGVSVYSLNLGFKSKIPINKHWVYVPESKYPFYRIGFPSEVMKSSAPEGLSSVFTEVSYNTEVPKGIDAKIIKGLINMGIIKSKNDIVVKHAMILKNAYVIYDNKRDELVSQIRKKLETYGVYTAGRWGNWEYSSMEDAILEGFAIAEQVKKNAN
ncbi:MAG: FAD-dependent oxidoreductase [bacterium]